MKQSLQTLTVRLDASGRPRALQLPGVRLKVLDGPDKRLSKQFHLGRVLIGTGEGAGLKLSDRTVSAVHCEIKADERGIRVVDLESKNGVILNGRRLQDGWIEPGDVLTLGETHVKVDAAGEPVEHLLPDRTSFGRLIGGSLAMRTLYDELARAASSDETVLLEGESGTGKELAAEAIVDASARRDAPFEIFDCRAVASTLFDSEFLGHTKGAFTGATEDRAGAFERANHGTLLLDGINELPLEIQAKLLRVLEHGEVQRLGASKPTRVNVRVIATTHQHLEQEVNRGRFRSDLFFRLAVIRIQLAPLREHSEDIPTLVSHFLQELKAPSEIPAQLLKDLLRGTWPGNVRELRFAIARYAYGFAMKLPQPNPMQYNLDPQQPYWPQQERIMAELEKEYLVRLIESTRGNLSEVSRRSGISRVHMYSMLRHHGLRKPPK